MPATLQTDHEPAYVTKHRTRRTRVEGTKRILLVEDEPLTAEVFARALSRDGHQVEIASDGLQALRHLRDRLPSLIVLDMSLPALPGAELVRRLRAEGHHKLPIIVVSGCARRQADLSAAELWPGTWLEKPVKPRELVEVVRNFARDAD